MLRPIYKQIYTFQSTLSQGERLRDYKTSRQALEISIHALARRATEHPKFMATQTWISIHALARRATLCPLPPFVAPLISIHALARRATNPLAGYQSKDYLISIHALARRATLVPGSFLLSATEFQSTLSQGERQDEPQFYGDIYIFQSTLSQGERH